jgi:hypothetical protein
MCSVLRITSFFTILAVAVPLCLARTIPAEGGKDEADVYAAAINYIFSNKKFDDAPINILVIEDHTRFDNFEGKSIFAPELLTVTDLSPELKDETLDNFKSNNTQSYLLERPQGLDLRYELVNTGYAADIIRRIAWREFYDKHPGSAGLVSLSKVGFDLAKSQAIVYVGRAYGEDGGSGNIMFLKKSKSGWKVQKRVVNWVWVG